MSLKIESLIKTTEFDKIVNSIYYKFNCRDEDLKQDLKQACVIGLLAALNNYDVKKNDNFWAYSRLFMTEYAKKEFYLQINTVHIPYNRLNSGFKQYDNIQHSYYSLDNPEVRYYVDNLAQESEASDNLEEIKRCLNREEREVLDILAGSETTETGNLTINSIAKTMGSNWYKTNKLLDNMKQKIATLR